MPDIERLKRFQREKEERERWAAEFESRQPEKGLFPFAESLVDVPMGQSNESHIPVIRVKLPENAKEFSKTTYGCSIGFNKQEMSWKEFLASLADDTLAEEGKVPWQIVLSDNDNNLFALTVTPYDEAVHSEDCICKHHGMRISENVDFTNYKIGKVIYCVHNGEWVFSFESVGGIEYPVSDEQLAKAVNAIITVL